jgi:hypothetical protein
VIIELKVYKENTNNEIECVYAVFCNFIPNSIGNMDHLKEPIFNLNVRMEKEKLKIKNHWYEMYSLFGYDNKEGNECGACCTRKKNTIYLPCKHSYACSDCSMIVRLPVNRCPMCRQVISDCLIID